MHPILLIAEALKAGMLFTLWSGALGGATGGLMERLTCFSLGPLGGAH